MKRKTLATLTLIALVGIVSLIIGLASRRSAAAQVTGLTLPSATIYALNLDNVIFSMAPGATSFTRLVRARGVDGALIGIDFRPADGSLYALSDLGKLYTIDLTTGTTLGTATLVSTLTTRFSGGVQSLMDFNPVVNAVRLIGSNDQNLAVINSSGNLNVTATQTAMAYAAGDVNAGTDPNISGGSYTNNYAGAASTLFYGIDYDLDTLVTISTRSATGSSNTGGGQLQTIGQVVNARGVPINFTPTTDLDIYTDANGVNYLIGVSGRTMFTIDISQFNQQQPALGTTQKVVAKTVTMFEPGGGYIDIALPIAAAPKPVL